MIVKKEVIDVAGESKLEIKDGKLIYYNGEGEVNVTFNKYLIVKVNGKIMEKPFSLRYDDIIDIDMDVCKYKENIVIEVSRDRLIARLKLKDGRFKMWKLKDVPMDRSIHIDFDFTNDDIDISKINTIISEVIKEKNIIFGVKWENIKEILQNGEGIIAQGKAPTEPKDDEIRYFFGNLKENNNVDDENKIDYYNRLNEVEFVEQGKILAMVEQGQEGKIGFDIYGKPINPRKRVIKRIKQGPGCEALDSGTKVIAKISGMPRLINEAVCVYPTYIVKGDVDYKIGNIEFHGNISVEKNVCEGIKLVSGNQIIVKGNVTQAVLLAESDIRVGGNIIASKLVVGSNKVNKNMALKYLSDAKDFLVKLINMFKEICSNNPDCVAGKISRLIKIIITSKLIKEKQELDSLFQQIINMNINKIDEEMRKTIFKTHDFINFVEQRGEVSSINDFIKFIDNYIVNLQIEITPANIYISYCQNSELISTNDVEISGVGCYNTNVFAENAVIFKKENSVLRGGKIEAKKFIKAKEVGSSLGATTILKTTKDGVIEADVAYQNTIIMFDEIIYKIEEPVRNLKAYIDKGELMVEKLKL